MILESRGADWLHAFGFLAHVGSFSPKGIDRLLQVRTPLISVAGYSVAPIGLLLYNNFLRISTGFIGALHLNWISRLFNLTTRVLP